MLQILEMIFGHVEDIDLKNSRLVCRKWNSEIKSHASLSVIVDDELGTKVRTRSQPPSKDVQVISCLEFLRQVNAPSSLTIKALSKLNYTQFVSKDQRKIVERLVVTGKLFRGFLRQVVLPFENLKELKISENALKWCDLTKHVNPASFLCKLESFIIFMNLIDDTRQYNWDFLENGPLIFDGKHIQWKSKNITFLLKNIGSRILKNFQIQVETEFVDINCCIARKDWRFEDFDVEEFICKHGHSLKSLEVEIPMPMPCRYSFEFQREKHQCMSTLPSTLQQISLSSSCGHISLGSLQSSNIKKTYVGLLKPQEGDFFNNEFEPANYYFWKALCLYQTELKSLVIDFESILVTEILYPVIRNNRETLEHLEISNIIPVALDGTRFQGSCIRELHLCVSSITDLNDGISRFWNIQYLPQTISVLRLVNMKITREDFLALTQLQYLQHICVLFHNHQTYNMGKIVEFGPILEALINRCHEVYLGSFHDIQDKSTLDVLAKFGQYYRENVLHYFDEPGLIKFSHFLYE